MFPTYIFQPYTKLFQTFYIILKQPYLKYGIAYSARSSGTNYKYKNGTKICSQDSLDLVRSINENNITFEQSKNSVLEKFLTERNTSIPKSLEIHTQDTPTKQYTEEQVKELISYLIPIHTPRK